MSSAPDELDQAWKLIQDQPLNVVAILGPYFGDGREETIRANIAEAKSYAVALANLGIGFFCPHTHTQEFGSVAKAGEPFYHRLDFAFLLRVADAALFTPRWVASSGTRREHAWSTWRGLSCFYPESSQDLGEIVQWNSRNTPFDRLELESTAEQAANFMFEFSCLPGWNKHDAAVQKRLRQLTSASQVRIRD